MTTPTFEFSIRTALKESFTLFKKHAGFFSVMALIMMILSYVGNTKDKQSTIVLVLSIIAAIVWSYVWLSVSLAVVDKKEELVGFSSLRSHYPTFRNLLTLIGVGILSGLFIFAGFVAFIIPGIYFMTRLMFANLAYVDRKGSVMQTLRYSWHMVKGNVFWTVLLTMLVSFGLIIIGAVFFGVGLLVAYPLSMLLMAKLYRAVSQHHEEQSLIVQPIELEEGTN